MNVLTYLERAALSVPDKTAYADKEDRITFRETAALAQSLSHRIRQTGAADAAVGVIADRDCLTPALFFAVLYSGNYYVPIDPDMPQEKIESILTDAGITVLLCSTADHPVFSRIAFSGNVLTPQDAASGTCAVPDVQPDTPCYMVYTSGSTGKPKGVLKSHGAVSNFVEAFQSRFCLSETDVFGNQTPFFFDASAKDIYVALLLGATVEVLPTELFAMPPMLIEYMNARKISFVSWVPTALSIVARLRTFSFVKPETLRNVFFVGEVMPIKYLNYWRAALPDVRYVNLYGQTELAGICCYYEVRQTFADTDTLPMGKALGNCQIYLMDGDDVITQPDRIGEMYIVSPALALGYYHDDEKNRRSFLMKDFGEGPVRCFRTGDMAKLDDKGNFVFAVRSDFQIKHMGHRIELGEIETVAGALPEVDRCCCLYDTDKSRIVLFVCLQDGCAADGRGIQSLLRPRLSSYMLPSKVIVLDELPLNANGKLDRTKIRQLL